MFLEISFLGCPEVKNNRSHLGRYWEVRFRWHLTARTGHRSLPLGELLGWGRVCTVKFEGRLVLSFGHESGYKTERHLLPTYGVRHAVGQGMEFPYSLGRGKGYWDERFVGEETLLCISDWRNPCLDVSVYEEVHYQRYSGVDWIKAPFMTQWQKREPSWLV